MHIFSFSLPSRLMLHYGLYTVICQAVGILFLCTTLESHSPIIFQYRIFPMLEHSLVSLVAIFIGVLGLEYIEKHRKSQE